MKIKLLLTAWIVSLTAFAGSWENSAAVLAVLVVTAMLVWMMYDEGTAKLRIRANRWDTIETMMILGDVELRQCEDGGYSIGVDPVESYAPAMWHGDSPEEVVDRVRKVQP